RSARNKSSRFGITRAGQASGLRVAGKWATRGTMKKALQITLGIVSSIGGFLDAGAIATSAQAGARFGFQLIWATLLGTICVIFLVEMSGRLAVVSHHALRDLIHERFGFNFSIGLLLAGFVLNLLVLSSEVGGVAMAMELSTGVSFRWWAIPA